jgi:MFS family permease
MLAATGVGAITVVVFMGRLRERLGRDVSVRIGSLVNAAAAASVVFAPNLWLALPGMFLAGASVLLTANSITVSAQLALPDWVRARGMSIYQMALMGGSAAGAALWGQVASWTSVRDALVFAAAGAALVLVATRRMRIGSGHGEELARSDALRPATPAVVPELDDGPVVVTLAYRIDAARRDAFLALMRETRRARLRAGALSWGLYVDTAAADRYVEHFVYASWADHLRHFERITAADAALRERRRALHVDAEPPKVSRWVAESLGE